MNLNSRYHLLTRVQKGEAWNEVCPLRFGENDWVFEQAAIPCAAILLLTDGLLDQAVPSLLFGQPDPLYRRFVSILLPPDVVGAKDTTPNAVSLGAVLGEQLSALLAQDAYSHLTDDLTAAALWRRGTKLQPCGADYLKEPDWEALRRERYYKLYPHLRRGEGCNDAAEKPTGTGETPES